MLAGENRGGVGGEEFGITTRPLYPEERRVLSTYLDDPDRTFPGGPFPCDPKRLVTLIYETGFHTDDLVHPERRKLHVAPDGRLVVVRAKKEVSRSDAWVVLTPHRRIAPWYRDFLSRFPRVECRQSVVEVKRKVRGIWTTSLDDDGLPKTRAKCNCAVPFDKLISRVCDAAGVPGAGMRTLRHTFACRWYELTHDINVVMEKTGCSLQTALRYAKLVGQMRWDRLGADLADDPRPYYEPPLAPVVSGVGVESAPE